jgi:hypothetical protein
MYIYFIIIILVQLLKINSNIITFKIKIPDNIKINPYIIRLLNNKDYNQQSKK